MIEPLSPSDLDRLPDVVIQAVNKILQNKRFESAVTIYDEDLVNAVREIDPKVQIDFDQVWKVYREKGWRITRVPRQSGISRGYTEFRRP